MMGFPLDARSTRCALTLSRAHMWLVVRVNARWVAWLSHAMVVEKVTHRPCHQYFLILHQLHHTTNAKAHAHCMR